MTVDPALYNDTGVSEEYATPVSRAKGQVIRLLPITIVWLVLTASVVWLMGLSWPYLLIRFSAFTAVTFIRLNRQKFEHSRNRVERHRIYATTDLREKELDQTHELKKMALTTYLEITRAALLLADAAMLSSCSSLPVQLCTGFDERNRMAYSHPVLCFLYRKDFRR